MDVSQKILKPSYSETVERIQAALQAAANGPGAPSPLARSRLNTRRHDPVTEADKAADALLRQNLLRDGEGWLSQESVDNPSRLDRRRVWVPITAGHCAS